MKKLTLLLLLCPLAAQAEFQIEGGPTNLSYDWAGHAYILTERERKWDFSLGWISKQNALLTSPDVLPRSVRTWYDIRQNMFISAQRVVHFHDFEVGVGPAYFNNISRVSGSHFMVGFMLGYNINYHLFVRFRHYSNAGTKPPNLGQDMITIGYRF
jgi:hypothetical protein